jgi:cation:H+ antiporter
VLPLLALLAGIALTFAASLLFTEAAERLGEEMDLGSSFLGSVVSPLFTSTPELAVLLISVLLYGREGGEVGAGTVLGEPFMVKTMAIVLVLLAAAAGSALGARGRGVSVDRELWVPYAFFTILYPLVVLPAALPASRIPVATTLAASYIAYAYAMSRRRGSPLEAEGPAILERALGGSRAAIALQLAASVPLLLVGSRALVGSTVDLSRALGIPTISLSIILVPLATALPETLSSMIWAFRGRDTLAVGALVGEAVMFSTVYPALGILLTDWALNAAAMFSVAATELASTVILWQVRSGRLGPISAAVGLALYAAYALAVGIAA